jgi:hypothetical protein
VEDKPGHKREAGQRQRNPAGHEVNGAEIITGFCGV